MVENARAIEFVSARNTAGKRHFIGEINKDFGVRLREKPGFGRVH